MSVSAENISELKNQLNLVVNKRKEAIEKKQLLQQQLQRLETDLQNALDAENSDLIKLQIEQTNTLINTTSLLITQQVYELDNWITTAQAQKFVSMQVAFNTITPLLLTPINETAVVSNINLDYIKCSLEAIQIKTTKHTLIIYPCIVLIQESDASFFIVPTASLHTKFNIDKQTSAQALHSFSINIPTIYDAIFTSSNTSAITALEQATTDYINFLNVLNAPGVKGIKKDFYQLVNDFGTQHIAFVKSLSTNANFISHVQKQNSVANAKYIESVALLDLLVCFNTLTKINDTSSNESFAMMYLQSKFNNYEAINTYEDIIKLNDAHIKKLYVDFVNANTAALQANTHNKFELEILLQNFDKDLHTKYLSLLYQFASIVIKADGKITKEEENNLKKIIPAANKNVLTKAIVQQKVEDEKTLEQLIYDLYDLTGLSTVKQDINTLINLIKIKKAREGFDLKNTDISLHIVFSGNPGTGKTTVARHLAKIYKCLGVLQKGHLIETDRSGMIAEYVGQTAIKVNKLVDSALDGVLFIDEAYALMTDDKDTYGKEAIATLLKRMEDNRDRLIVVLAGYSDEMKTLIDSNPGLKSRFNKYIYFPDYNETELYSIFIGLSRKLNFTMAPGLEQGLKTIFDIEIAKGEKSFGNSRFVRNLFEKMLVNQANRLAHDTELSKEKLTTLMAADLPEEYLVK
jgi:SpoVK/Ycf46/Vps4 family AAA+-type ATPase